MELELLPTTPESMEVDENWEGSPHPLLIDHVIEKICHHLLADKDDRSVFHTRLVCHLWDNIATNALRSNSNKALYFGKYFRTPEALLEFTHYLQSCSSMEHFPLGKFHLCEDIFKSCHHHIVQSFFTKCALLIHSLTIRLDNQSDLKVCDVNFANAPLSQLRSLVFDDRSLVGGNNNNVVSDSDSETLLEILVKSSPNLEKLTVIHPAGSMFDDAETVITHAHASERHVAEMLAAHFPKHLRGLNLDIKLNDKVLSVLSEIPVNLAELQLNLRESIFSKESLSKLLISQKDTLRRLRLSSMGAKSHFEVCFPTLPHLQLLELHSWDSQVEGVTFSPFTYKNFPNINSLVLHTWAENPSWIQFFPAAYYGTVPSVRSLKLPQNFMYPALIQNLAWLFPNLTKLDLHYSKQTSIIIQRIFNHFSGHLEELKIRDSLPKEKFDVCLDPLFTGLPQPICEKILRTNSFDPDPESNHYLKMKSRPSLLNLKKLRKLDFEDMLNHETYVTDVTGYLVLLQMSSLCYLNMGRSQISDECLGQLANKYPTNMTRELQVPKPPPRSSTSKTSISGYYCSSMDLFSSCMIS